MARAHRLVGDDASGGNGAGGGRVGVRAARRSASPRPGAPTVEPGCAGRTADRPGSGGAAARRHRHDESRDRCDVPSEKTVARHISNLYTKLHVDPGGGDCLRLPTRPRSTTPDLQVVVGCRAGLRTSRASREPGIPAPASWPKRAIHTGSIRRRKTSGMRARRLPSGPDCELAASSERTVRQDRQRRGSSRGAQELPADMISVVRVIGVELAGCSHVRAMSTGSEAGLHR